MISESEIERMFEIGFDCSQIVLSEVADKVGIDKKEALRAASCFGIGMAQCSVCGAATGAMIALGLKYGNDEPGDMQKKAELFKKRDEFMMKFKKMNGDVMCPDMLGQPILTLEDMITSKPSGIFKNCPKYCINALKILDEML